MVSYQLRNIHSVFRWGLKADTHERKAYNGKIKVIALVVNSVFNLPFMSFSRCKNRYGADLSVFVVIFWIEPNNKGTKFNIIH